jgi:hypothetical protein
LPHDEKIIEPKGGPKPVRKLVAVVTVSVNHEDPRLPVYAEQADRGVQRMRVPGSMQDVEIRGVGNTPFVE